LAARKATPSKGSSMRTERLEVCSVPATVTNIGFFSRGLILSGACSIRAPHIRTGRISRLPIPVIPISPRHRRATRIRACRTKGHRIRTDNTLGLLPRGCGRVRRAEHACCGLPAPAARVSAEKIGCGSHAEDLEVRMLRPCLRQAMRPCRLGLSRSWPAGNAPITVLFVACNELFSTV
jgi:hypothetical protein